jgi:hypothetical protein
MHTRRLSIMLLAVACTASAETDESDPRPAQVTDTANSLSQVSAIKVSAVDPKFGFDYQHQNGRIAVATKDIELAIPLRAVSLIHSAGIKKWTVKYQTKEGEASVSGGLPEEATMTGDSDFGAFSLLLGKLKRLEFSQAGVAAKPAESAPTPNPDGKTARSFAAVLTLTDGTSIPVSNLRRHANFVTSYRDTNWFPPKYSSDVNNEQFTDFRFVRGEAAQTIPFEKIKVVDFTSDESVTVTTKTDAKADMKLSQQENSEERAIGEARLTGFTGTCGKGDFYVAAKFVKSIAFGDSPK